MTHAIVELRVSPAADIRQAIEEAGSDCLLIPGCDQALLGIAEHPEFGTRPVYVGELLLPLFCEVLDCTLFEAQERLDEHMRDLGAGAPVIVWTAII